MLISETILADNPQFGVRALLGLSGPGSSVVVERARISGSNTGVQVSAEGSGTGVTITLKDSVVFNNNTALAASGGTTGISIANTTITGNDNAAVSTGGGGIQQQRYVEQSAPDPAVGATA